MSRPAASCALMTAATASRYCSRNKDSPSAALNDRPLKLMSNQSGRGYDPVIAVGSIKLLVVFSIALPPASRRRSVEQTVPGVDSPRQDGSHRPQVLSTRQYTGLLTDFPGQLILQEEKPRKIRIADARSSDIGRSLPARRCLAVHALNRMLAFGRPVSVRVA